jgi:hypothetical protein
MSKKNSMLLTLLFTSSLFSVSVSLDFPFTVFFRERLSNHYQGLRHTFPEICTGFDAVPLSGPSRNLIRPDTRLQIKRHEISARPPSYVHWLPRYTSTNHLPLHRDTTTAVQMATPVPEIMDMPRTCKWYLGVSRGLCKTYTCTFNIRPPSYVKFLYYHNVSVQIILK